MPATFVNKNPLSDYHLRKGDLDAKKDLGALAIIDLTLKFLFAMMNKKLVNIGLLTQGALILRGHNVQIDVRPKGTSRLRSLTPSAGHLGSLMRSPTTAKTRLCYESFTKLVTS